MLAARIEDKSTLLWQNLENTKTDILSTINFNQNMNDTTLQQLKDADVDIR